MQQNQTTRSRAKRSPRPGDKTYWATVNLSSVPALVTPEIPGPKSRQMHQKAALWMKGYSSQVRLFPVCFAKGHGVTLTDVDGNTYLDFSSGIYVTGLGHCHPKVSEAVAKYARTLMNCHDFTTPVKAALLEKLVGIMPGDLNGIQLYDSGTTAVEAGLRVLRAATGKNEFISCFRDFHGKTGHAVSLARMKPVNGPARAAGFYMVPRPDPYRPHRAGSPPLSWSLSRGGPVPYSPRRISSPNCASSAMIETSS